MYKLKVRLRGSRRCGNLGNSFSRTWQDLVALVEYSRSNKLL
jgi:hypothetical protein